MCNFQNANREEKFENGPQLQREEAIWKIPMLKLLGELLNKFGSYINNKYIEVRVIVRKK